MAISGDLRTDRKRCPFWCSRSCWACQRWLAMPYQFELVWLCSRCCWRESDNGDVKLAPTCIFGHFTYWWAHGHPKLHIHAASIEGPMAFASEVQRVWWYGLCWITLPCLVSQITQWDGDIWPGHVSRSELLSKLNQSSQHTTIVLPETGSLEPTCGYRCVADKQ